MLDKFEDNNYTNIEDLNSSIQATANITLKKKFFKKKYNKENKPWFSKEIETSMKEKRLYNRKNRNETDKNLKESYWKIYNKKKDIVNMKITIRTQKGNYEREITNEIKANKDNKNVQWKYLANLKKRGKSSKEVYL